MVAKRRGRDQRAPMERLVKIAAVLRAHGDEGVAGERLAAVAGFSGDSKGDQIKRELRHLEQQGWLIDNVAGQGEPAHYRMRAVDNRLRVRLTPGQQEALRRAVLLADRGDLVERLGLPEDQRPGDVSARVSAGRHDEALSTVVRAVRIGAILRFDYKGTTRKVHPVSLRTESGMWYLRGVEHDDDAPASEAQVSAQVKTYVVARMSQVSADQPGTARAAEPVRHGGLHPMTWEIDPPVEVTLRVPARFRDDVVRCLGEPEGESHAGAGAPDDRMLTYRVTNREALRSRLYELGERVQVAGPEEIKEELLAQLRLVAGYA